MAAPKKNSAIGLLYDRHRQTYRGRAQLRDCPACASEPSYFAHLALKSAMQLQPVLLFSDENLFVEQNKTN
jgi:hypothetical protein